MAVDHTARLNGVVKAALKEAAMGETFGYFVTFTFAPMYAEGPNGERMVVGLGPAWFVFVTIRGAGLTDPDIGKGRAVEGGVLPDDEPFRDLAVTLLEECREERGQAQRGTMAQVGMDLTKALERRGN